MCAALLISCQRAVDPQIRLNQVGFAPNQEKTATIDVDSLNAVPCEVLIVNEAGDSVWSGVASETMVNPVSGKFRQIVDFSDLTEVGEYSLLIPSLSEAAHFIIRNHPYRELTRKALRAFYYQRASMDIVEPYAEGFARPAGHPDDHVLVHASAATDERPEGTVISSPGGWYDAGDYNKYIVNSGYTMGVWLMAYELNKAYFDTLKLNIPESGSEMPDMLAEAMYNIRWMMTMQDTDGGVYHKLTEPNFEGFIRPDQCKKPRYVVLKTTAAALDFAATMALAARVYAPYDPDFCAQAKEAAEKAYAWALEHPEVYYDQPALNEEMKKCGNVEITTGAYDDFDVQDEFYWAATELYLLTKEEAYMEMAKEQCPEEYVPAVWGNVGELAHLEWMMHPESLNPLEQIIIAGAMAHHLKPYLEEAETVSVYRCPYGNTEDEFFWGCNSEGCCWRGIECLYAYHLSGDKQYLINAERCLNYILGQNSTGYCYVTGFGSKPTSHPHHRLSYSHPKGTHPGFLAGGPNRMRQDAETDGVKYPKNVSADESYLDYQPSYATNEVTINWNVTLFALSAGIDAITKTE
jgi:endoglucanase